MNQSQKENTLLTAWEMVTEWRNANEGIEPYPRDIVDLMEAFAAQQVKQVTEERDKALELLRSVWVNGNAGTFAKIQDFLNSLNAAKEGGE